MVQHPKNDSRPLGLSIVGLIPAAGRGSRLGDLPCSKELLPVGYASEPSSEQPRVKVASEYLIEQMLRAGCDPIYFILRKGKWDLPTYFGSGDDHGAHFGYLLTDEPHGPPFTLAQAATFAPDSVVVAGFPDILLDPPDMLARTLDRLLSSPAAEVMLATLPAQEHKHTDLVRLDRNHRVAELIPKEAKPVWQPDDCTWCAAVWRPRFTEFLVAEVGRLRETAANHDGPDTPEWPLGAVVAAAIDAGFEVHGEHFPRGSYLDIGAPDRLVRACDFAGVWNGR